MIFNKRDKLELTADQIQQNWNTLIKIIDTKLSKPRSEKLKDLYLKLEDVMMLAPAAPLESHHSCFPGGYVDHVLNVIDCGIKVDKLWSQQGSTRNASEDELIFSLLNHDLGKIGYIGIPYYVPNDSDWHVKTLGARYKTNPDITYMSVPDRGLFMLQQNNIPVTANEYLAIKCHDGLFDEANKSYYISYKEENKFRTNLPIILHQADYMASVIEYEKWKISKK